MKKFPIIAAIFLISMSAGGVFAVETGDDLAGWLTGLAQKYRFLFYGSTHTAKTGPELIGAAVPDLVNKANVRYFVYECNQSDQPLIDEYMKSGDVSVLYKLFYSPYWYDDGVLSYWELEMFVRIYEFNRHSDKKLKVIFADNGDMSGLDRNLPGFKEKALDIITNRDLCMFKKTKETADSADVKDHFLLYFGGGHAEYKNTAMLLARKKGMFKEWGLDENKAHLWKTLGELLKPEYKDEFHSVYLNTLIKPPVSNVKLAYEKDLGSIVSGVFPKISYTVMPSPLYDEEVNCDYPYYFGIKTFMIKKKSIVRYMAGILENKKGAVTNDWRTDFCNLADLSQLTGVTNRFSTYESAGAYFKNWLVSNINGIAENSGEDILRKEYVYNLKQNLEKYASDNKIMRSFYVRSVSNEMKNFDAGSSPFLKTVFSTIEEVLKTDLAGSNIDPARLKALLGSYAGTVRIAANYTMPLYDFYYYFFLIKYLELHRIGDEGLKKELEYFVKAAGKSSGVEIIY